jgi:hypothetical protein
VSVAAVPAVMGTAATDKTPQCDDDQLKQCIIAASTSVWGVPEMFPAQLDTVYHLLHPTCPNHLAVIQRTGAVKIHILRTLGVIERGIVPIFIPLLTMSTNVMSKFTSASMHFRTVILQHLNELFDYNRNAYRALLERCRALLRSRTMTLFIFLSPRFVINHPDAREVFIECSNRTTLWVVTLDEAHIHVQHGMSFRSEICALQTLFFSTRLHFPVFEQDLFL